MVSIPRAPLSVLRHPQGRLLLCQAAQVQGPLCPKGGLCLIPGRPGAPASEGYRPEDVQGTWDHSSGLLASGAARGPTPCTPSMAFLKVPSPDSQDAPPRPLASAQAPPFCLLLPVTSPPLQALSCRPCLRPGRTGEAWEQGRQHIRGLEISPRGLLLARGRCAGQFREWCWEHGMGRLQSAACCASSP